MNTNFKPASPLGFSPDASRASEAPALISALLVGAIITVIVSFGAHVHVVAQ